MNFEFSLLISNRIRSNAGRAHGLMVHFDRAGDRDLERKFLNRIRVFNAHDTTPLQCMILVECRTDLRDLDPFEREQNNPVGAVLPSSQVISLILSLV